MTAAPSSVTSAAAAADNEPLITAHHVSVVRRRAKILNDVTLSVFRRDFITVVGPNGAGKTTLLKCIAGLLRPDFGEVRRAPGVAIGYVPQRLLADYAIPLTAGAFMALRKRANTDSIRRAAEEAAVDGALNKPLYALSGGELQRVLLARALLDSPDLLVLDEPAQNLDVSGRLAFYQMLAQLYERRQIGILMVSHDLHLVMAKTRRVVCLYHHICCEGAPQQVASDPEFTALLGSDMARMTAVYHHTHDHQHDL